MGLTGLRVLVKAGLAYVGFVWDTEVAAASGAATAEAFDIARERLTGKPRNDLDAALERAEQRLARLLGDGVAEADREPIVTNAATIVQRFGPRLSAAPYFTNDPDRMAREALEAARKFLAPIDAHQEPHVRRLVQGFYAWAMADKNVLDSLRPHVERCLLEGFARQEQALAGVPAAVRQALLDGAASALLHVPRRSTTLADEGPTALLRAENAIIPFVGRHDALAGLLAWCDDASLSVGVRLYVGEGGQGKTRLLLELLRRLLEERWQERWSAGFLRREDMAHASPDAVRTLVGRQNVLAVIDYAETRREDITALLRAARECGATKRLRLVLLARGDGDWWDDLLATEGNGRDLLTGRVTEQIRLSRLAKEVPDKAAFLAQAAEAFARETGKPVPDVTVLATLPGLDSALEMAIAALLAVLDDAPTESSQLFENLLRREESQWKGMLTRMGVAAGPAEVRAVRQLAAAGTLLGPRDGTETVHAVAMACPTVRALDESAREAAIAVASDLYGAALRVRRLSRSLGPVEPDRVGEALVDAALHEAPALLDAVYGSVILPAVRDGDSTPAERALTMLTRLTRLAQREQGAARWLDRAFADDARAIALAPAAITVAQETGDPIGQRLAAALERAGEARAAEVARLERLLPYRTTSLREVAVAVMQAAVALPLSGDSEAQGAERARRLGNLSNRLADLGRRESALAAIKGAVALYRTLAQARPDAFTPDLATSLNNLSNNLANLGRREEALAAIEEAVAVRRTLAQARPDSFTPDLAQALNNLSVNLANLGRREEALAAIDEAVTLRRTLAQARPDTFTPDLAQALNNLSNKLANLGRREEALAASKEAVALYCTLAEQGPDAFTPDLARSLKVRGDRLRDDDLEVANASYREAVETLAPAFQRSPQAFAGLMRACLSDYRAACAAACQWPNEALIAPIEATLDALPPSPPQTSP